jgi:hypothetical protein
MPLEPVGAFQQLAVEQDPTSWLRREAASEPKLGKFHERWDLSVQGTTLLSIQRQTCVRRDQVENPAAVVRQTFADPRPVLQTKVPPLRSCPRRTLPAAMDDEERIRENLTYLVVRDLIERDNVSAARELLSGLPLDYLSDPLILRLLRTLARPVVRQLGKQDIDRQKDYAWLRDHSQDYTGQWVALNDGRIVAVAATLRDIRAKVKALCLSHPPLIHQIR